MEAHGEVLYENVGRYKEEDVKKVFQAAARLPGETLVLDVDISSGNALVRALHTFRISRPEARVILLVGGTAAWGRGHIGRLRGVSARKNRGRSSDSFLRSAHLSDYFVISEELKRAGITQTTARRRGGRPEPRRALSCAQT